jgi:post-segregation antitoxin (ccd killing protein)
MMITYRNAGTGETYEAASPVAGLERSNRWQRVDEPTPEAVEAPRLTEKRQLVEDARARGLDASGTKDALRARVEAYDAEQAALAAQGDGSSDGAQHHQQPDG